MCGRFALIADQAVVREQFRLARLPPEYAPHTNLAPGMPVLTIRPTPDGQRQARYRKWGLVPPWAKDPGIGNKLINARSETAWQKPAFRESFLIGRCLIPASGFYEWQPREEEGRKARQPYYFQASETGRLLCMAGLISKWVTPQGEALATCCILTTDANPLMAPIHDRMPVLLPNSQAQELWLGDSTPLATLRSLLVPIADDALQVYPVCRKVNRSGENDPDLVRRAVGAKLGQ